MVAAIRRFALFAVLFPLALSAMLLGPIAGASAQVPAGAAPESEKAMALERSPVTLDGEELFSVRGITAHPARGIVIGCYRRTTDCAARIYC